MYASICNSRLVLLDGYLHYQLHSPWRRRQNRANMTAVLGMEILLFKGILTYLVLVWSQEFNS